MIGPIHSHLFVPRSAPPLFNEGAALTASKVVAFVATALASLASFLFFPAEAALMLSAGAVTLLSLLCCAPDAQAADQPQRWYQPVVNAFPVFVPRGAVPVVQPGPRVPVGGVIDPHVAPAVVVHNLPMGHQEGARVGVGHGHALPGAVAVVPQARQPQQAVQPAFHPIVHAHPVGDPLAPDAQAADQLQRWYQPVVDAFRVFVPQGAVPVVQPGPGGLLGGVVHPHIAPENDMTLNYLIDHQEEGARAGVGHGHALPGGYDGYDLYRPVAAMPQAVQPAVHPIVHAHPIGGPPHQHGGPAPHRVPVGHRAN